MNTVTTLREAASHSLAGAVVISLNVAFAVVAYFGLLAWAMVAGLPLGGPLALSFLMVATLVASVIAILLDLFPATALAHYLCRRWLRWPALAEIPVSTVLAVGVALGAPLAIGWLRSVPVATSLTWGVILALLLLVPLGVYWWVLRISSWGLGLLERGLARLSPRPERC